MPDVRAVIAQVKADLRTHTPVRDQDVLVLLGQIEKLEKEGVPGVTHAVDREFHKLAILERDHERERNERLRSIIRTLRGGVDLDGE